MQPAVSRHRRLLRVLAALPIPSALTIALLAVSPTPARGATFTVINTSDSGPGSLRQAIVDANATADQDVIEFNIPGDGPHTIAPASQLPAIIRPLTIDGYTQPGASANTLAVGNDAVLKIELSGANVSNGAGLSIFAAGSRVTGLALNRWLVGILLVSHENAIDGNFIGIDTGGVVDRGNGLGVYAVHPANTIGGTSPGARNVISGNDDFGVYLFGGHATGNLVQGNYIGTTAAGNAALANGFFGILVADARGNTIGGTAAGAGNVISGNNSVGVYLSGGDATANLVQGNYIGTTAAGTAALANRFHGIFVVEAPGNTIGGTVAGARNVISGNRWDGVRFQSAGGGNLLQGNLIGTNAAGTSGLGNGFAGVSIDDTPSTTIGGASAAAANVISGNGRHGVVISESDSTGNLVQGNFIGTNAAGTGPIGNGLNGVDISADGNVVGLAADGSGFGNTIANNGQAGVYVAFADANSIRGNTITGNGQAGVFLDSNDITGTAIRRNSISGNGGLGIDLGENDEGPTPVPNDPLDLDSGPNQFQNYPVLTDVSTAASTTLQGSLNSSPTATFDLDFFASADCDASGNGEGATYIGSTQVTTNVLGAASFNVTFTHTVSPGEVITATATDSSGNTSEFSACLGVPYPKVQFDPSTYSVDETAGTVTITVTRTGDTIGGTSTVDYATSADSATAGSDYTETSGTVTFVAGDTSETFTVPITDDALDEDDETLDLALSDPDSAELGDPATAELTILDDDPLPTLSLNDVQVDEGDSGSVNAVFTITLSVESGRTVTVDFDTSESTADEGTDYQAASGTVTFDPGETTQTVTVAVSGDAVDETDETFFVDLSAAVNATLTDARGTGTIVDNDPLPTVSIDDVRVNEGNSGRVNAVLPVTLSGSSGKTVTVDFDTAGNTATEGTDYQAASGTLTFDPGETTQTVTVSVTGDVVDETDETFFVDLSDAANATITDPRGTGTIVDDDAAGATPTPTPTPTARPPTPTPTARPPTPTPTSQGGLPNTFGVAPSTAPSGGLLLAAALLIGSLGALALGPTAERGRRTR